LVFNPAETSEVSQPRQRRHGAVSHARLIGLTPIARDLIVVRVPEIGFIV
jgi:hypothetical protein